MNTSDTATADAVDEHPVEEGGQQRAGDRLATVAIDLVIEHPDNVRADLGDLDDLTRSIKHKGVLVPLLVLPADDNGHHALVAGHRRRAAARAAGCSELPVIIRDLTPIEVLDTMLTENDQRCDLSLVEQIRAVARYQVLAPTETPTAIGKRIGRTVRWVKDRFAVAALPADVVDRIGTDLSLAAAIAVGGIVERGDDVVRGCVDHLIDRRRYNDLPSAAVEDFIRLHDAKAQRDEIAQKLLDAGVTVFASSYEAQGAGAERIEGYAGLALDDAAAKAHRKEPCHAEAIVVDEYNGRLTRTPYCTDPGRHRGTKRKPAESSIVSETKVVRNTNNRNTAEEKKHREARQARCDAVTRALTKRVPKIETQRLAALILIDGLDQAGRKQAAKLLGVEPSAEDENYHAHEAAMVAWLDDHPDPTALLAALAIGHLETRGTKSSPLSSWGDAGERRVSDYRAWLDTNTDVEEAS